MSHVAVVGPTASGKSDLAVSLARRLEAPILSVDSMQVYRGMDIGTAKPSKELQAEIPHHLIDLADPGDSFTVSEFQRAGDIVLDGLEEQGTSGIIAGGSGLHFRALIDALEFPPTDPDLRRAIEATDMSALLGELLDADPAAADNVDLANPRRVWRAVEIFRLTGATPAARATSPAAVAVRTFEARRDVVVIGVDPGDAIATRIDRRFRAMVDAGLVEEIAGLVDIMGVTARQAVGYKELLDVVESGADLAPCIDDAVRATKALAKRQRTFFRKDPRIRWISWHDDAGARLDEATRLLEEEGVWNS